VRDFGYRVSFQRHRREIAIACLEAQRQHMVQQLYIIHTRTSSTTDDQLLWVDLRFMAGSPGEDIESSVLVVEQAREDSQKLLTPALDDLQQQTSNQCSTLSRRKRKKPSTIQPSAPTPPLSHSEQSPFADTNHRNGRNERRLPYPIIYRQRD
jgi:hypothetical protein